MRATATIRILLAAGLLVLAATDNSKSNSLVDVKELSHAPALFQPGNEYIFEYNGQIATGLNEPTISKVDSVVNGENSLENPQKAMTRIQAQAKIHFVSAQRAHLQLVNVRVGEINGKEAADAKRVQPLALFQARPLSDELREAIEAPCAFDYVDGVVERVYYAANEPVWAQNAKRAVLNLIQLNLRGKLSQNKSQSRWSADNVWDEQNEEQKLQQDPVTKSFVVPETSIEGDCLTLYTINSELSSMERSKESQQSSGFNVTKSINFMQCAKIADVAFGFASNDEPSSRCMRISQSSKNGGPNVYPIVDNESCDPKEVSEGKVQRSTVTRVECASGSSVSDKCAIKRAETLSNYILRNPLDAMHKAEMNTITISQLIYRGQRQASSQSAVEMRHIDNAAGESLMYDNAVESDEKRFFMLGDKCEKCDTEFKNAGNKVAEAVAILRVLIEATIEKHAGIEGAEAAHMQHLVEVLRYCTVSELQTIYKDMVENAPKGSKKRVRGLFADALAIAGTRNTVHELVKKIQEDQITSVQAAKSLMNLQNPPAASDEIASELWSLCESEKVRVAPTLRQSCVLMYGAMISTLCRSKIATKSHRQELQQMLSHNEKKQRQEQEEQLFSVFGTQTGFDGHKKNSKRQNAEELLACAPSKKQVYKQTLMQLYHRASSTYEKILALKALGNAGLDTTVNDLEAIIVRRDEMPLVRAGAVDAMRRLRKRMPHRIQRVCLPVYQNTKMPLMVRSVALRTLLATQPSGHILDQMLYTLSKERSASLRRVAYTTAQAYAASPVNEHREMSKHLKNALRLTGISPKQLKNFSQRVQIPFYSPANGHGLLINLMSMFGEMNAEPFHLSAGIDAVQEGKQHNDILKVSMTQESMSGLMDQLVEAIFGGAQLGKKHSTRGNRAEQDADNEMRDIYSQLKIKNRKHESSDSVVFDDHQKSYAMFVLRIADVDQAILPFNADDMRAATSYFNTIRSHNPSAQMSVGSWLWHAYSTIFSTSSSGLRSLSMMSFVDQKAYIPTSVGMPVKITRTAPLLTCIEMNASKQSQSKSAIKVEIHGHVIATAVEQRKVECASPLSGAGIQSTRVVETNLPLNSQIDVESEENGESSVKLHWMVPQHKTRLFGTHTIAQTYNRDPWDKFADQMPRQTRAIVSSALEARLGASAHKMNIIVGERSLGIPLHITGKITAPSQLTDVNAWMQLIMSSENHIHVTLTPNTQTPRQLTFQMQGSLFRRASTPQFIETLKKLDKVYQNYEEDFRVPFSQDENESNNSVKLQKDKLMKAIEKLGKKNVNGKSKKSNMAIYKHAVKLSVQTQDGSRNAFVNLHAEMTCDARFQACALVAKSQRSPMYAGESAVWRANVDAQMIRPETVSSPAELARLFAQKQQKFLANFQCKWGASDEQFIQLRVQGLPTLDKNTNKRVNFLNQFDMVSDYKLQPNTQNFFTRGFDLLKSYNYWSIEMPTQSPMAYSRDGQVLARFQIQPKNAKVARCEVRTPTQAVRINNIQLGYEVRPMPLIRSTPTSTHSVTQMFSRFLRNTLRAECTVSAHKVQTFDNMIFNGPMTSSCYSVLAKDCANQDSPQFAVLMKSLESNGQQKKIKVIVPGQKIECQAKNINSYDQFDGNKITCTINGQPVKDQSSRVTTWSSSSSSSEEDQPYKSLQTSPIVEFNNEERTAVMINAPSGALTVHFACQCADCKCQTASIQLSSQYKNAQCGLCGHFDDDETNEWRSADNQDVKQNPIAFHRSYSLADSKNENGEDMCTSVSQNNFYEQNKQKFNFLKKRIDIINTNGKWSEESSSGDEDEGFYDAPTNNFGEYAHSDDEYENNRGMMLSSSISQTVEPELRTKIIEHQHQMCFSKAPVPECPKGSSPYLPKDENKDQNDEFAPWNADEGTSTKVNYVCMPRYEAGPLARAVFAGQIHRVEELLQQRKPSFTNVERVPTACRRY